MRRSTQHRYWALRRSPQVPPEWPPSQWHLQQLIAEIAPILASGAMADRKTGQVTVVTLVGEGSAGRWWKRRRSCQSSEQASAWCPGVNVVAQTGDVAHLERVREEATLAAMG